MAWAADPPDVGVVGGLNINSASINDSDGVESSVKGGGAIGGFVSIPVKPMFSVVPEVFWTSKHIGLNGTGNSAGFNAILAYEAVEIPVLLKIDLSKMKTPSYYALVGPGFSFTTKAKLTHQTFNGQSAPDEDLKAEDDFAGSEVTLILGFGVAKGPLAVEARYDLGFKDLATAPGDDTTAKSRVFSIFGRWTFKIKK